MLVFRCLARRSRHINGSAHRVYYIQRDTNRLVSIWLDATPSEFVFAADCPGQSESIENEYQPEFVVERAFLCVGNWLWWDKPHAARLAIRVDIFIAFLENFAGFFICENSGEERFQRAAAILSRTKILSQDHYALVKQHFKENGIYDEDLTSIVLCD